MGFLETIPSTRKLFTAINKSKSRNNEITPHTKALAEEAKQEAANII